MIVIQEYLAEINPEMLLADGFEDALIGYVQRCGTEPLACYDIDKCIEVLIERDGMTDEEAIEYLSYNTLGAYMGENTPMFLTRLYSEMF